MKSDSGASLTPHTLSIPIMQPKLALYISPMCGYCHYVMSTIEDLGLDVEIRNIFADRKDLEDLYKARNRTTVPVLRITTNESDQWMPESRDIVAYLQGLESETFGNSQISNTP